MRIKKVLVAVLLSAAVFSTVCGVVTLSRFWQMSNAISEYNNKDYKAAITDFDISQNIFSFEDWKKYFNIATSYLKMADYSSARDNYEISYNLADNDNSAKCLITTNWAISLEQAAGAYDIIFKQTNSVAVKRVITSFLTQASILRQKQAIFCINQSQDFLSKVSSQTALDSSLLSSYTKESSDINKAQSEESKAAENKSQQLNDQNTDGISEYLNAYDLINGSTDFQGEKW
ncbi:MAG: hypothetical protein LBT91_02195 [Bifidobacteriaceae bacterium]|jgi:tetratricopeptide (TPR) repeat protein|nr:hypothetical protein [Bifidobacteriaceae bacterium]